MSTVILQAILSATLVTSTLLCSFAKAATNSACLHLSDRTLISANFVGFNNKSQLLFDIDGKQTVYDSDEIVYWSSNTAERTSGTSSLLLTDGSVLKGLVVSISSEQVLLQHKYLGAIAIPIDALAGVQFFNASLEPQALYTAWASPSSQAEDTIYLNDGSLSIGTIQSYGNTSGSVLDSTQAIELSANSEISRIAFARIAAIRFSPVLHPVRLPANVLLYCFDEGTQLAIDRVQNTPEEQAMVKLASGLAIPMEQLSNMAKRCITISAPATSQRYQRISEQHLSDIKGQSQWTRNRWVYFAKTPTGWKLPHYSSRLICVPSFRAGIVADASWKKLTGVVQLRLPPSGEPSISDAFGSQTFAKTSKNPQITIRFIELSENKLLDLLQLQLQDTEPHAINVEFGSSGKVYMVVEDRRPVYIRTDVVFDQLRLSR